MLKEIQCDIFTEDGKQRKPIIFNNGLNIILGDESKKNSIGKSTFLLVIDFVFGGNAYADKNNQILKVAGPHTVKFCFDFNGNIFYFTRSIENSKIVNECNNLYEPINVITLEKYTDFLKEKYKLENINLTFRQIVGAYSWIAGRSSENSKEILEGANQEALSNAINSFEKLFPEKYKTIEIAKQEAKIAKEDSKAFNTVKKRELIESTLKNQTQVKQAEKEIEELEKEMSLIINEPLSTFLNANQKAVTQFATINAELKALKAKRNRLKSKIDGLININTESGLPGESDFSALQTFFPTINIQKLSDIEHFHKTISSILKIECNEQTEIFKKEYDTVLNRIQELTDEIVKIPGIEGTPASAIKKHEEFRLRSEYLKKQIELYAKGNELGKVKTTTQKNAENLEGQFLIDICNIVNSDLVLLNNEIEHGRNQIPVLKFAKSNASYTYSSGTDTTGTGSSHSAQILFDLAILKETQVPFLIHDSYIFDPIGDERLSDIILLYRKLGKQVFIALDGENRLRDDIKTILKDDKVTVLHLGKNEKSLFGKSQN